MVYHTSGVAGVVWHKILAGLEAIQADLFIQSTAGCRTVCTDESQAARDHTTESLGIGDLGRIGNGVCSTERCGSDATVTRVVGTPSGDNAFMA